MVNYRGSKPRNGRIDAVFAALADPTRRGMIERLSRGPATVGELGDPYPITKPAVTKHVKMLERAGLIRRDREGRVHRLTLRVEPMRHAEAWIEWYRQFWEDSLDSLTRYVRKVEQKQKGNPE